MDNISALICSLVEREFEEAHTAPITSVLKIYVKLMKSVSGFGNQKSAR